MGPCILFWCVLSPMSVFPRTYTEYSVPDRGRGIYKKISSRYPVRSPRGQKNPFFSAYQGIYRKIVVLHPFFCDQRGMDTQFFCIYPVSLYKPGKKGEFAKKRGTAGSKDDQNRLACVGGGDKPQLYAPRKSLPDLDSFHQQVRRWTVRRNAERAARRMHGKCALQSQRKVEKNICVNS